MTTLPDGFTSEDPHAGHLDGAAAILASPRSLVPSLKYIDSPLSRTQNDHENNQMSMKDETTEAAIHDIRLRRRLTDAVRSRISCSH